jgi:hydroxymethylpyrimidine pyrophosphatase-like HAD family hydrolase
MGRVLYFDIDGTLLDYEDQPKSALLGGRLQRALMHAGFAKFVCVSGWSDLFASPVLRLSPEERKRLPLLRGGVLPSSRQTTRQL